MSDSLLRQSSSHLSSRELREGLPANQSPACISPSFDGSGLDCYAHGSVPHCGEQLFLLLYPTNPGGIINGTARLLSRDKPENGYEIVIRFVPGDGHISNLHNADPVSLDASSQPEKEAKA